MQRKRPDEYIHFSNQFINYSKKYGHQLNSSLKLKKELRRDNKIYCPECNTKNNLNSTYCKECGHSLENIEDKRYKMNMREVLSNLDLSNSIKVVGLATGIMLLISLIINIVLRYKMQGYSEYIGILDMFLLINGGILNANFAPGNFMTTPMSQINIQMGVLLLIILPVLCLILSYNLLKSKKKKFNESSDILGLGIVYSLVLVIFSIIARRSVSIVGEGSTSFAYTIMSSYSIIEILIKGFIIGCISGLIINFKGYRNIYFDIFKEAIKVVIKGYIIVFIILAIGNLIGFRYVNELGMSQYTSQLNIGIIISQLAAYIWGFANLSIISIGNQDLSLFNLISSGVSTDFKLCLIALIAISALILLVVGYKLRDKFKELGTKSILIFSIIYSLVMGVLGIFTVINVDGGNLSGYNVYANMNFIITIFSSFLYSYAVSLLGYKLNDTN